MVYLHICTISAADRRISGCHQRRYVCYVCCASRRALTFSCIRPSWMQQKICRYTRPETNLRGSFHGVMLECYGMLLIFGKLFLVRLRPVYNYSFLFFFLVVVSLCYLQAAVAFELIKDYDISAVNPCKPKSFGFAHPACHMASQPTPPVTYTPPRNEDLPQ